MIAIYFTGVVCVAVFALVFAVSRAVFTGRRREAQALFTAGAVAALVWPLAVVMAACFGAAFVGLTIVELAARLGRRVRARKEGQ